MQELSGAAGGSWRIIDEVFDSNVLLQQLRKTSVLSMQSIEGTNEFKVLMLIGDDHQQFTFTIEHPQQESFTVIGGDIEFCKFFKFNQHISAKVGDLVGQFERGKIVELPVCVGDFYTPEEAMELQKHFRQSDRFINEQPTEALLLLCKRTTTFWLRQD